MKKNEREIITKKDLFYWMVLLMYTIIIILTVKLTPKTDVIDYFSFGGTLASILLAIIAMIYSFFQNFSMQSSSDRLNETVTRVEKSVSNLDEFDTGIRNISNEIELAGRQLATTTFELREGLNLTIDDLREKLTSLESSNVTNSDLMKSIYSHIHNDTKKHKNLGKVNTSDNIGILICKSSDIFYSLLKCIYKLYKTKKNFSTDDVIKLYLKKDKLEAFEGLPYLSLILAFISLLMNAELLQIQNITSAEEIHVESINQDLEEFIISNLEKE